MFKKGQVNNPRGRPKGSKNKFSVSQLEKAFQKAKKKHKGIHILDHLAEKAYTDNQLALALLRKMLPDKRAPESKPEGPKEGEWANKSPSDICKDMDKLTDPKEET